MFRIHERFTSVQGEAFYTGMPAHFLRFQGCPVMCQFCDTRDTWKQSGGEQWSWEKMQAQIRDWRMLYPCIDHIVLTGGEPFYNNPHLPRLIDNLIRDHGFHVQVETSGVGCDNEIAAFLYGTVFIGENLLSITLSPKDPTGKSECYMPVHEAVLDHTFQVKFPVANDMDVACRIPNFFVMNPFRDNNRVPEIWLQPVDYGNKDKNAEINALCMSTALAQGWRISVQTHKILNVR